MQKNHFPHYFKTLAVMPAIVVSILAVYANTEAAQETSNFQVKMEVKATSCAIHESKEIDLNIATSTDQLVRNYVGFYKLGGLIDNYYTSTDLNQTTVIECTIPSTKITSFLVRPASGSAKYHEGQPGLAAFTDDLGAQLGGQEGIAMIYEQVTVTNPVDKNNVSQSYALGNGQLNPYVAGFYTDDVSNGKATVTWRPSLHYTIESNGNRVIGSPNHGIYTSLGVIEINY